MNRAGPNRRGGRPLKYPLTDERRRVILAEYDSTNRRALAGRFGVPAWAVTRWAGDLGVRRVKERPWSPEDVAYLRAHVHRVAWAKLARHLGRSVVAVKLKAKRLGEHKVADGGYTQRELARLLGVDDHKVARWVRWGCLKARNRGTDRLVVQGGDAWLITEKAVRDFVRRYPGEIDLRRVDALWFIDLAFGTNSAGLRGDAAV